MIMTNPFKIILKPEFPSQVKINLQEVATHFRDHLAESDLIAEWNLSLRQDLNLEAFFTSETMNTIILTIIKVPPTLPKKKS